MELKKLIEEEYNEIQLELSKINPDYNSVTDKYNTILEIKRNSNNSNSIYLDLKQMSKYHLLSLEHKNYNYDQLNLNFINRNVEHLNLIEKIAFLDYLKSLLKKYDLKDNFCEFKFNLFKSKISYNWKKRTPVNIFKIIFLCINYNIYTLFIFLVLFICFISLLFLPAPKNFFVLFEIENVNYMHNSFLNNIFNVSLWLSGLNDDLKIKPLNLFGLIFIILIRITFIGVLIDLIFNELKDKLKL